jgi:hypothetical protein
MTSNETQIVMKMLDVVQTESAHQTLGTSGVLIIDATDGAVLECFLANDAPDGTPGPLTVVISDDATTFKNAMAIAQREKVEVSKKKLKVKD